VSDALIGSGDSGKASFDYLPHVGEVGLRVTGTTIGEVLRQAGLALATLLLPGGPPSGRPHVVREIAIDAPDRAALLIDWLNELLYLADRDRWVPNTIDIRDATDRQVRASASGPVLDQAPTLVKAATWHDVRFDARNGTFEARILLDI
jgi:SHS2 domain-containing protein